MVIATISSQSLKIHFQFLSFQAQPNFIRQTTIKLNGYEVFSRFAFQGRIIELVC